MPRLRAAWIASRGLPAVGSEEERRVYNEKSKFGKGLISGDKITNAITSAMKTPAGQRAANTIATMIMSGAGEGAEEAIESVANTVFERIIYNPDASFDLGEIAYEALAGAALGAISGGSQIMAPVETQAQTQTPSSASDLLRGTNTPNAEATGGLKPFTQKEIDNFSSGKRNKIAQLGTDIVSFVQNAMTNKNSTDRLYLGKIPDAAAARASEAAGVDVSNYNIILPSDAVRHTFSHHGDEGLEAARGQSAITDADFSALPQIISAPDAVYQSPKADGMGRSALFFEKNVGGNIVAVLGVSKSQNSLIADTLYYTNKRTRMLEADAMDVSTPRPNARNELQQGSFINTNIPQNGNGVNNQYAQSDGDIPNNFDAMGAASAGFAPYSQLQNQTPASQFYAPGENPTRDVEMPMYDSNGNSINRSARTIVEAEVTPTSAVPNIEQRIANGEFSHITNTDEGATSRANDTIRQKGWDTALNDWTASVRGGEVSKDLVAMGATLYNNAISAGRARQAIDIAVDLSQMVRAGAQATQAMRILKQLSPDGKLYAMQRSVQSLQEELTTRFKDKAPNLVIDEALADNFLKASDAEMRAAAEDALLTDIARQIPSTPMDKWNQWRYLSMLGNPRTHIRNILGNLGFAPIRGVKNLTGTALENVFLRNGQERTKAVLTLSAEDRARQSLGKSDYATMQDEIMSGGKFVDRMGDMINERRTTFKNPLLEKVSNFNTKALDLEDVFFAKQAYSDSFAQYMKANNITSEAWSAGDIDTADMDKARAYAIREAQKATYRDTNDFSDWVSKIGRGSQKSKNPFARAAGVAAEGILPFKKTPANILVRGVEYSPAGLIKGLSYDLVKVHKGDMSAATALDNIASGLTGTGLLALGAYLAAQGLVTGGEDDDENRNRLFDLAGQQNYALEIGGKSITLDWLAPEALPFFVGVELFALNQKLGEGDMQFKDITDALQNLYRPMLEMSMLQGINDVLDASKDGILSGLTTAGTNYLTQGIPTLLGQLERTAESESTYTYTDANSPLSKEVQLLLGRVSRKIPGWDYAQQPYVDALGRREETGSVWERGANNLLNPASRDFSQQANQALSAAGVHA